MKSVLAFGESGHKDFSGKVAFITRGPRAWGWPRVEGRWKSAHRERSSTCSGRSMFPRSKDMGRELRSWRAMGGVRSVCALR